MAQAGQAPSTYCPAARLARQAAALILQAETADAEFSGTRTEHLFDRVSALAEVSSHVEATSALGAYYQMVVALSDLDPEMPWVTVGEESAKALRRLSRLSASVAAFLRNGTEVATSAALAAYYTDRATRLLIS